MCKCKLCSWCLAIILLLPWLSNGQVIVDSPEHATFDVANDRYLICSFYEGSVVAIDNEGITDDFITGLGRAFANHIVGDTLYVTAGLYFLKAFNLTTGDLLWSKYISVTLPPEIVMPNQLETGPVSQLVLFIQLVPSVLSYSATRARESF